MPVRAGNLRDDTPGSGQSSKEIPFSWHGVTGRGQTGARCQREGAKEKIPGTLSFWMGGKRPPREALPVEASLPPPDSLRGFMVILSPESRKGSGEGLRGLKIDLVNDSPELRLGNER